MKRAIVIKDKKVTMLNRTNNKDKEQGEFSIRLEFAVQRQEQSRRQQDDVEKEMMEKDVIEEEVMSR